MASLHFVVVAALLASFATAAPPANTTDTNTKTSLVERGRLADEACRNSNEWESNACHMLCVLKNLGGVDHAGRYIESGAADMLALGLPVQLRVEETLNQAAKACNSVNDHIVEGCNRSIQISDCLCTEFDKITKRDSRAAMEAAANKTCVDKLDTCYKSCVFTSFEMFTPYGSVSTSGAIDFLAVTYPNITRYTSEDIAYECDRETKRDCDMCEVTCEHASRIATCFEERYFKKTGKRT